MDPDFAGALLEEDKMLREAFLLSHTGDSGSERSELAASMRREAVRIEEGMRRLACRD